MIAEPARQRLGVGPLKRGMKTYGIDSLPPAVIRKPGQGWMLLAGERRWIARRELGLYEVHSIQSWADFLAWMILDREDQRQHQRVYDVLAHDLITAAYATNRVLGNLRAGRDDFAQRVLAEYLGQDYQLVSTTRTVMKFLTSDLPEVAAMAKAGLEEVRLGQITPSGAHSRIKNMETLLRKPRTGAEQQRKVLDNLVSVIGSIVHELDNIGQLSDQLSPEDCQRWLEALMRLNERGYQTRRALRERINGSADHGVSGADPNGNGRE